MSMTEKSPVDLDSFFLCWRKPNVSSLWPVTNVFQSCSCVLCVWDNPLIFLNGVLCGQSCTYNSRQGCYKWNAQQTATSENNVMQWQRETCFRQDAQATVASVKGILSTLRMSTAFFFFWGGYGQQVGLQTFLLPGKRIACRRKA